MMTRLQLLQEVRNPSAATAILNHLRTQNDERLWADAFAEALHHKKYGLAKTLLEDPQFAVISEPQCNRCLTAAVQYRALGSFLTFMHKQRPHLFTPATVRTALTACVEFGNTDIARYMVQSDSRTEHQGFIPERADDLKYIFHARSRSEETPFVQRLEEERKETLSAIAGQITNLPPR